MISQPDITQYSDQRLAEYHEFCARQARDFTLNTRGGRNGRMAWRRERNRVENEINERQSR